MSTTNESDSSDIINNVDDQQTSSNHYHYHPVTINNIQETDIASIAASLQQSEQAIGDRFREFGNLTTAHGIPRILSAKSVCAKIMWTFSFIFCVAVFAAAVWFVTEKFNRHEVITNIQIKLDQAQFPAITLCSLNPYKKSLVRQVGIIKDTMDIYAAAKENQKETKKQQTLLKRRVSTDEQLKSTIVDKRSMINRRRNVQRLSSATSIVSSNRLQQRFEAILAHCVCIGDDLDIECIRFETEPITPSDKCICTYDHDIGVAWPCFNQTLFINTVCSVCYDDGYCDAPSSNLGKNVHRNQENVSIKTGGPCYCRSESEQQSSYCIATGSEYYLKKLWAPNETTPTTTTTTAATNAENIKAMGFSGMTDPVAMLTRAKENLVFTMASLSETERIQLSYDKDEFIQMCSFNGHECDIDHDFRLHVDPVFGNCYTFNYDLKRNLTSKRAGPMYGIRILLFVNTSEFMATSESAGVRIAIHSKSEYPFPDTFGYSAPTGFASSFGIKKKIVARLPAPYGDCISNQTTSDDYIYQKYDYHPEALIEKCGCGDPRFPVSTTAKHCSAFDSRARECLEDALEDIGDFHHNDDRRLTSDCECKPPCNSDVYDVTFSCSQWPSGASDFADCEDMTEMECEEYYRKNAAMVEIFFEQLTVEYLRESEAYGWVNLIADFGGHLGLWMGFSVITVMEILVLLFDITTLCCKRHREKQEMKRLSIMEKQQKSEVDDKRLPKINVIKADGTIRHRGDRPKPIVERQMARILENDDDDDRALFSI